MNDIKPHAPDEDADLLRPAHKLRERTSDPEVVIKEMCQIRAFVAQSLGWEHAADCICATRRRDPGFIDDGPVTEFIRQAVHEKIGRRAPMGQPPSLELQVPFQCVVDADVASR